MEKEQIFNIIDACNMHRQKVLGVCMRYFGFSIDDAEDCVQEAYFALYNDLLQGKKIQNPTAWLYKGAINQGKKLVCAQQQKKRIHLHFYGRNGTGHWQHSLQSGFVRLDGHR